MISHVFKPRRKNAAGKSVSARLYRGRYRLDGDFTMSEVALGTADKQAAERKLATIITEKERERAGLIVPKCQREAAQKPLLDHLDDFISDLQTKQRAKRYISDLQSRVIRVAEECKWKVAGDVQPDHFMKWRSRYKAAPKTLNEYLNACNALLNWMVKLGRITSNPLKVIDKINLRGKQQLRRALTDDEFSRLLAVSEDYRLLYLTAVYTGFRRSELMQLIVADVKLAEERPYLIAQASTTKNGKKAVAPMHPRLITEFHQAVAGKEENERVFPQYAHPDKRFRRHLKEASIAQIDASGRKLDFHSLRYTFATKLARKGVSQRLAQELMRHSDPRLTANIYTDTTHLPTFDAVKNLPWHNENAPLGNGSPPQIAPQKPVQSGLLETRPVATDVRKVISQASDQQANKTEKSGKIAPKNLVGKTGFEPATPRPPAVCSTRLSYIPVKKKSKADRFRAVKRGMQAFAGSFALPAGAPVPLLGVYAVVPAESCPL